MLNKAQIIAAIEGWIKQRPGLDYGNYGDPKSYRAEVRSITADMHDARVLLRAVEMRDSITAEMLLQAFPRAYSGRLSISEKDGRAVLDYCTGQYWPTEYRRAACAVLASAIWDYWADQCMPAPDGFRVRCYDDDSREYVDATRKAFATRAEAEAYAVTVSSTRRPIIDESYAGLSAGDWLRRSLRHEFGARIARRWFN